MKKQLFLISLILAVFTGFAQEGTDRISSDTVGVDSVCHHRILLHVKAGGVNNIYNRIPGAKQIYSWGNGIELGYAYMWDTKSGLWGIGIGAGLHNTIIKGELNISGVVADAANYADYNQASHTPSKVEYLYATNGLIEKQRIWALEIPLTAQYENKFGGKNGIYAQLGVRGYIPLVAKTSVKDGGLTVCGYDEFFDSYYTPQYITGHGFGEYAIKGNSDNVKLRCSVDLQADFGGVFEINKKLDFYLGAYCSYGFLDILPAQQNRKEIFDAPENPENITNLQYNGLLASDYLAEYDREAIQTGTNVIGNLKWNRFEVGIKLGFNIKPCGRLEESAKDKFYRKMTEAAQKYLDDTCKNDDKNVQYVYIVPVPEDLGEKKMTKKEKKAAEELAEALQNIKILFDLDKDIPKINDQGEWINKAVDLLKANPDFGLRIEGYTCPLGSEQHNRDLANRRALSIKRMLMDKGVPADQLETVTYTANDPENAENIKEKVYEEHRAAILHIIKK